MPDLPLPENHPQAQWLWPWPPERAREFFAALGAAQSFTPGPEPDQSTLLFMVFLTEETDDATAQALLAKQAGAWSFPQLTLEQLASVQAKPVRLGRAAAAFIAVPIAVLPTNAAAEYGSGLQTIIPLKDSEPPDTDNNWEVTETAEGFALTPGWLRPETK